MKGSMNMLTKAEYNEVVKAFLKMGPIIKEITKPTQPKQSQSCK